LSEQRAEGMAETVKAETRLYLSLRNETANEGEELRPQHLLRVGFAEGADDNFRTDARRRVEDFTQPIMGLHPHRVTRLLLPRLERFAVVGVPRHLDDIAFTHPRI